MLVYFLLPQSQVAERGRELKELKDTLALLSKEKEKLQEVSDRKSTKCTKHFQSHFSLSALYSICL